MHRAIVLVGLALIAGCGASIQKPESLTQAQSLYQTLQTQGADRRAEGDMIRARGAIDTAQSALAQAQNQEYVNGISAVALRVTQTAEATNARVLAQHSADSLRDVRYAKQLALAQAQGAAARARADSQAARADSLRKAAEAANAQLGQAMQQLQSLVSEMTNIKETARGLVLSLSDILFDVGQATLKPTAQKNIQQIAAVLKQYPSHHIAVEGYTDATGGDQYNLKLSMDRAASVRTALVGGGIDSTIISSHGFGKANPVASNTTADGRAANRRVEIIIEGAGLNDKSKAATGAPSPAPAPAAATVGVTPAAGTKADTARRGDSTRRP
jgi:outer membrane protein OmpA-like peptidoglycan-associated protein